MINHLLSHPLTRNRNLDDPETTRIRKQIIREKKFLNRIYREWYDLITHALPKSPGPVLELGSGAGFLADFIPTLITSEILRSSDVRLILDGQELPFKTDSMNGIVMTNVFHHIPDVYSFLSGVNRVLKNNGTLVMIEPWATPWSRWVYTHFHHEPFDAEAIEWKFPSGGPVSGANNALPWIVFERDRAVYEREFPELKIMKIKPLMPIRYLLSGGIATISIMPGWTFPFWKWIEQVPWKWSEKNAMFAFIVLQRINHSSE